LAEDLVELSVERLNKEIKRRADVVEIFPNPAAFLRLATAVVIEAHDEWKVTRRYLSDVSMDELRVVIAANTPPQHCPTTPNHLAFNMTRHDSLIASREPHPIRCPPLPGTLSDRDHAAPARERRTASAKSSRISASWVRHPGTTQSA
jgi:hypothetical protein